ncbi:MAG: site-2 protease family protein [Chloroflexi bacterium]|nr:site-2 protease family protein [Chloroflexota bacterium]
MMTSSLKIGRFFGINIRIDWSWLLIFFLITWNLAASFDQIHDDWQTGSVLALAVIAAVLFFASVLIHELAHSLVAQARGVPVRSITLFLFGGVSNIERDPDTPKSEFLITIVGPLASIILGVILLVAGNIIAAPIGDTVSDPEATFGDLEPAATLFLWLGSINLLLGFFNLIPGFPLDGGRLLRSALWASTGNLRQATRWASWVGQGIAWLFIVTGIAMVFGAQIPIFGTGVVGGLWLAFIGWFLNSAAVATYQRVVVQDVLADVTVADMMRSNPPTVASTVTIQALVDDYVMKHDDHAFPVVDNQRLVGLITLQDIRNIAREKWSETTVQQAMTPIDNLMTVEANDDAADAWTKLARQDVRQVPVVTASGSELTGVLRRRDIVRWLQVHSEVGSV